MNILYVAATEFEIDPFLRARPGADFLVTGVGIPMTVYHLVKRLQQIDYDMVIQAGIAGSFTNSLLLGEVVFVSEDNFADLGISEQNNFSTISEMGFMNENEFPFTKGWLKNPGILADHFPLKKVSGITVNTVTDNVAQIAMLKTKFDVQVETMEGAAFHYTCLLEKVPFMQLRSISNYVGERDKSEWELKEAIENLNNTILKMTDQILSGAIKPFNL